MSIVSVAAPRLEYGSGATPVATPRISWVTSSAPDGWLQRGAEVSFDDGAAPQIARVEGRDQVLVDWPFAPLPARGRGTLRVRVEGPEGWSDWSPATDVDATFLGDGEWSASFIGLADAPETAAPALLRRAFTVRPGLARATLYATALGAYQAEVNGRVVDDQILKPGWTPYQFRLVHETTDVTDLMHEGDNALGVALTGGWYTERYGFQGQAQPFYGSQPAFAGQVLLEYEDGSSEWLLSDATWTSSGETPFVRAGIYLGEDFDATLVQHGWSEPGFDDSGWEPAELREAGPVPGPRTSPAVRVTQQVPVVDVLESASGTTLLDFGQNLVGRLRIRVSGRRGDTVTLRHAEVLEDGELGTRPLRVARATDSYTLAGDGDEDYAPSFTFHGFRYAEVTGWPGDFDPADVVAEVIGSDLRRTGWFESSDAMVDRLHENVVWGMRGNFLYLPTDCPQRDERLGWTGDIQVFSPTASFLFDSDGFLASWLVDLALEQEAAGGVPFIVPDVLHSGAVPAAAWGDAATLVPWVLHERFGDRGVVATQYPSMRAWVDQILAVAGDRLLWEGGFQFGDWVDPDAPHDNPARAKTDPDLVASAYLFRSTFVLSEAAALLGHDDDARHYADLAERIRAAWLHEYATPAGRLLSDAQTAYALAIAFDIATGDLRASMGERLAWLVRRDGYRIGTGFVGTPLLTEALSSTGHLQAASRMLLQTECPSWLYSVSMGATTIWERWDSLLEDGSINPGEMTSFNHYALGAIADWLQRIVGGLAPAEPGYRSFRIAPTPLPGLTHAASRFDSPYGQAASGWRIDGDHIVVTATIPPNTTAQVALPDGTQVEVGSGAHEWRVASPDPGHSPAPVTVDTPLSAVIGDKEAYDTVLAAFHEIDPVVARDFQRRTAWVPNQSLLAAFSLISPKVVPGVSAALERLNRSRGHLEGGGDA